MPEEATTKVPGNGTDDTVAAKERAHETDELFARMQAGDERARDELIERFLPLARQLARRYQRAAEPLDDLVQVASIGLVKAVDRFDAARGVAFSSYAVPTILGELKRYFRDSGWAVHVPRGMQERAMQVDRAIKELAGRLGRSPSVDEVAEHTHSSVEDVLGAMEAGQAYESVSLDSDRGNPGEPGTETVADGIGETDERFELVEYGASIAPAVKALSDRDRLILHLRFVEDLTQSQIADRIGVSQMQISRLIRRSLARLRAAATE
ncbi:MAG: polymerase sigma-B factor [Solirubrobacteraceae bacterium]|nr:polymerase sigma-B factor [Solirubrobacteraceae bacterium]